MNRCTRAAIAAAALSLPAAVLTLAPSPAQAVVIASASHTVAVNISNSPSGTTCTGLGVGGVVGGIDTGPFAADGVAVTHAKAVTATITNDNVAADKTTVSDSGTSTITASQAAGQLSHVSMTANANASVTTAVADNKCHGRTTLNIASSYTFDLLVPTMVTIHVESHQLQGQVVVGAFNGEGQPNVALQFALGARHSGTDSVLLPAGTAYIGTAAIGATVNALDTAGTATVSGDFDAEISFEKPGTPTTDAQGTGKKYVALGDRDCTTGAVAATWSRKAGKGKVRTVTRAAFTVNGQTTATAKKPKKNQVTKVPADPTLPVQVQVLLKVKGKGQLLVQRSYRPCT